MIKWNLLFIIGNDKKFRKRTFSFDETAKSLSKISRIAHLSRGRIVWVSCGGLDDCSKAAHIIAGYGLQAMGWWLS